MGGAISLVLLMLACSPCFIVAMCECGYVAQGPELQTNGSSGSNSWVFTNTLESNFNHIKDISADGYWRRQQFNVSAQAGRGKYGKAFLLANVDVQAPALGTSTDSESANDDSGLKLRVSSTTIDDAIPGAEIDSSRNDLYYGSYRAGMKLTPTNGTCAAFFWYFNDTQEIDMEFLSREFDRETSTYPVNLVIQSQASLDAGFDASKTGSYKVVNLTFDPTAGFHEYRFDYLPGQVLFYADSQLLTKMTGSSIPSSPGHLILQHWSNGNSLWSGGPPNQDAFLTVSYVKAYFNTSGGDSQVSWAKQCAEAKSNSDSVCVIPSVTAANASTGGSFFNESSGGEDKNSAIRQGNISSTILIVVLMVVVVMNWL